MSQQCSPHHFPASGCWLHFFSPMISELAGSLGYDYVMIDMEHGAGGIESVLRVLQATQPSGAKALIRIPEPDPRWVGRMMDLGADGVMVPMLGTAAETRVLAGACRYPPNGTRGMAPSVIRASGYGGDVGGYLDRYRRDFLLIVQIETPQAATELRSIAAVEDVDVIFIGPYDFSAAVGFPGEPDHPEVQRQIRDMEDVIKAAGKKLGGIPTPGTDIATLYARGYDLVLGGFDMAMLRDAMHANLAEHRIAMGRSSEGGRPPETG